MPAAMEKRLKAEAKKKGLKGKAADAYVYGTMNKAGVMKGNKITQKGKAMEKKDRAKFRTTRKTSRKKKK